MNPKDLRGFVVLVDCDVCKGEGTLRDAFAAGFRYTCPFCIGSKTKEHKVTVEEFLELQKKL